MELASDSVCSSVSSEKEGGPTIPQCLHWTTEQVAEWIESLDLKQYRVGTRGSVDVCVLCSTDIHP